MGRLAREGHLVALDTERSEDDTERHLHRLEHRPLLDVELEVGGRGRELGPGLEGAVEVDAVLRQSLRQRNAVGVPPLPKLGLVCHRARGGTRAEEASARSVRPPRPPS